MSLLCKVLPVSSTLGATLLNLAVLLLLFLRMVAYPIALKEPAGFVRFDKMEDKGDPPALEELEDEATEEENLPVSNTDEEKYLVEQATCLLLLLLLLLLVVVVLCLLCLTCKK